MRPCLVLLVALVSGCNMLNEVDPDEPLFLVYIRSPAGGSFTVEHRNELGAGGGPSDGSGAPSIFQGTGAYQEVMRTAFHGQLDTSAQEIKGTFKGAYVEVGFGTRKYGGGRLGSGLGAESGSLQSLLGPDPQASLCSIRYGASEEQGSSYRVQFRFTEAAARACREP